MSYSLVNRNNRTLDLKRTVDSLNVVLSYGFRFAFYLYLMASAQNTNVVCVCVCAEYVWCGFEKNIIVCTTFSPRGSEEIARRKIRGIAT